MKKGYHLPKPYKMKVLLKQTVRFDAAQNELVVSLGRMDEQISIDVHAYKISPNTKKESSTLVARVNKQTSTRTDVSTVMEATRAYHKSIANYLNSIHKQ